MLFGFTSSQPESLGTTGFIPVKRLFRHPDILLVQAQAFLSIIASVAILLGLAYWRTGELGVPYRLLAAFIILVMFIVYKLLDVSGPARGRLLGLVQITKGWVVTVFIVLSVGFITKTSHEFSRLIIGSWVALSYMAQIVGLLISFQLAKIGNSHFGEPLRTLVVGSNVLAKHLVNSLNNNVWLPDQVWVWWIAALKGRTIGINLRCPGWAVRVTLLRSWMSKKFAGFTLHCHSGVP